MDGPIFLTNILACRATLLAPSPAYAVSTVICFFTFRGIVETVFGELDKCHFLNSSSAKSVRTAQHAYTVLQVF